MLTVGTDTYATLAEADDYHAQRGNAEWAAVAEAEREVLLRRATDWIENTYDFDGERDSSTQVLSWPRKFAHYLDDGRLAKGYPPEVKTAQIVAADLLRQAVLETVGIIPESHAVKSEQVGSIKVEYDTSMKRVGLTRVPAVDNILRNLILDSGHLLRS